MANIEDAQITLGGKRAENFGIISMSTMSTQMMQHYKQEAMGEVFKLLGKPSDLKSCV